ncbi:MAG: permease-like cell division protein FtsX [Pseudomonadota bacterium]
MKDYKPAKRATIRKSKRSTEKRSHFGVLIQAIDLLSHHLFGFFVLIVFTSILLSLPLTLTYLLQGMGSIGDALNKNAQVSVYLTPGLNDADTTELTNTLNSRGNMQFVGFISPDQGLQEFEKQSGLEKLNDYINTNPIPGVIMLKITTPEPKLEELNRITEDLSKLPGVESVAMNGQWLNHAVSVITSISTSLAIATAISFFLSLVIIVVLLNFLLPESLEETSNLTMVYLGILLGIITGIAADYWVSYFAHMLDQLAGQMTFLNLTPDHFHLAGWDIFVNQVGCWITLIIAALIVRHYHRHMKG